MADRTPPTSAQLVLVADDEQTTTVMLHHILSRAGYRVESVHDGQAALEAAERLQPAILLLDVLMPVINGFEVLRRLRAQATTAHLPTILVTANARQPEDVARGLRLGADDYIQKPFAPQELLARIESKLRSARLENALQERTRELEALLHVSETLSAHVTEVEILDAIVDLVQQSMPESVPVVVRYNEAGQVTDSRSLGLSPQQHHVLLEEIAQRAPMLLNLRETLMWSRQDPPPLQGLASGMLTALNYRGNTEGLLLVAGQAQPYTTEQRRLLEGAAQQAAVALVNARLYDMLADYAQNLESMVGARTAELQSAQRLLVRSEKLASIGRLAASIAHEINNPLMPLRNLLEDIISDLDQQQVSYDRHAVTIIEESIERIRGIVSRMLEFARDSKSVLDWVDVSQVLDTVITLNRKSFEHDRLSVEADIAPMPLIYASRDQLQQVFMNIMLNAHAAMSAGSRFTVVTRAEPDWVVVEMTDTGCGIPRDALDRIFEPFYTTKPTGTGLGLFVSHNIIQAHQGAIEVESQEGIGTTFRVRLPRSNETPHPVTGEASRSSR
jgi:signal transduction histidine kinase